jgi:hypothetical protein
MNRPAAAHRIRGKRRVFTAAPALLTIASGLWGTLALYFAIRGPEWVSATVAVSFALAMIACTLTLPNRAGPVVAAGLLSVVLL